MYNSRDVSGFGKVEGQPMESVEVEEVAGVEWKTVTVVEWDGEGVAGDDRCEEGWVRSRGAK